MLIFPKGQTFETSLYEHVEHWLLAMVCKIRGHELISLEYSNPDSGYMGTLCIRCGLESGQQLY